MCFLINQQSFDKRRGHFRLKKKREKKYPDFFGKMMELVFIQCEITPIIEKKNQAYKQKQENKRKCNDLYITEGMWKNELACNPNLNVHGNH